MKISSIACFLGILLVRSMMAMDAEDIPISFDNTILQLVNDINPVMSSPRKERAKKIEQIIKSSFFYSFLQKTDPKQDTRATKTLKAIFLDVVRYVRNHPDDEQHIVNILVTSIRILEKEEAWQATDPTFFCLTLYLEHEKMYGNMAITPILTFIDAVFSAGVMSKESQKFMHEVTYKNQFIPIANLVLKAKGKPLDEHAENEIARIGSLFFTDAVYWSYQLMSKGFYNYFPLNLTRPMKGMKQFRQVVINAKYFLMQALEDLHIYSVEQAKQKSSTSKSDTAKDVIKVIEKKAMIDDRTFTLSFAVVEEEEKITIKAIVLEPASAAQNGSNTAIATKDVYFFVEELQGEDPTQKPNPGIQLSKRPLYKFEHIPGTNYIRLQEASVYVHGAILDAIKEIEDDQPTKKRPEFSVEVSVHTAIRHQQELMLVEIIRQVGSMLSSRALWGEIQTFLKTIKQPKAGYLSVEANFLAYRNRLEDILNAVYVLVTNEYLASWYKVLLIKPIILDPSLNTKVSPEMKQLKDRMDEVLSRIDDPFKFLRKSMMTCGFDGNPEGLASPTLTTTSTSTVTEKAKSAGTETTTTISSDSDTTSAASITAASDTRTKTTTPNLKASLKKVSKPYPLKPQLSEILVFSEEDDEE
ncbi:MAG TPA: hypothetical protein VEL47_05120 [Myxococcota bacterium]|nr:hypothetical protein [Myxococcota bacterium]